MTATEPRTEPAVRPTETLTCYTLEDFIAMERKYRKYITCATENPAERIWTITVQG